MKRFIGVVTVCVLLSFYSQSAVAAEVGVSVAFSKGEIEIISAWYHDGGAKKHKGRGKGKRNGLPPGIAKNLRRGKPIPPGIAKQYLPDGLRQALPAPPKGYERIIVDGKVLLVEIATQVIHDVLMDVVLN
jgi:Ni/Co efflux regulator RcnB